MIFDVRHKSKKIQSRKKIWDCTLASEKKRSLHPDFTNSFFKSAFYFFYFYFYFFFIDIVA